MNELLVKMDDDLEHFLYVDKHGMFCAGKDLRHKGCPECDPSIKVDGGYYLMCEKHYEEWGR